ncbi:SHOCT domain-containing protein [Streptomyces sp. NPDC060334]|uniref:SHOCT domain-containing protein n=1 Tax=unclassified Streptomyces TaxID=2593676 RepID=UPI00225A5DD6|nr:MULTISPECIES: SHOCT domain-containing protein [unclassified Streptomyces]MCX5071833.1 SHOCT domain-containing protein [Streptomyces sp. NBC_00424]MCX5157314.1 SHOCT domain-containing protein [Streptomyces sp. NBC_00291]WUD44788.1 SHOCT domain-containing protein [Streptomyces sp. NBC_00513]
MARLLRGIARTAVVAGTATAVSNRVSRRQSGRWADQEAQAQAEPAPQAAPVAAPVAAPGDEMSSKIDQLKELGTLKEQGLLTDEEFAEQKRRILG